MKAELTNIKITITPEERGKPNAGPNYKPQRWRLVILLPSGVMRAFNTSDGYSMTAMLAIPPSYWDGQGIIQPVVSEFDTCPPASAFVGAPTLRELLGLTPPKPVTPPPDHSHETLMFMMRVHIAEMQKILDELAEVTK